LNAGIAWWLFRAAKEDLNIRSAFQHMVGDAAASFGVVIAGIVIALTGAYIADPIVSIIFAALVLWSSWSILTEAVSVFIGSNPSRLRLGNS
jgi:cobalt-zinc-cadmium efflux system protein